MKKVITVDFDETLAETNATQIGILWSFDGGMSPIPRVINFVKEKASEGYDIYIVTAREPQHKEEAENFCRQESIPFKDVICCSGKDKTPILKNLRSHLHIDDNVQVCVLAHQAGINVLLVNNEYNEKNSTSELFNNI